MTKSAAIRCAMAGVLSLLGAMPATAQDRTVLYGSVVRPDGTLAPDMAVVIAGGKIESVLPAAEAKPGAQDVVVRFGDGAGAVISAGLIDLRSGAGAMGETSERLQKVDPGLTALDAISVSDRFFTRALEAGITSVMVAPSETNIVGGVAATLRTNPKGATADVLRSDGPMTFTIGTSVLDMNRGPTSRAGALTILRDALASAKAGTKNAGDERLAKVINRELDALVVCESAEDVDAAARTFGEYGVRPNLVLGVEALEAAEDLAGSDITVVVGPLTFGSSLVSLNGPAKLEKADLEVAFAGRSPAVEAAGLRVTAALAVRYGLDPAKARQGMTRNAARVAGVADRVGTLEPGKDADIVVFSNDPLRLDAKVLEVYVHGARAYVRPATTDDEAWSE